MIKSIQNKTKVAREIVMSCDCCGKVFTRNFKSLYLDRKYHFCSEKCTNEEKKSGGKISDVSRNTCLSKYGVENVFQDEHIKEKIKSTHMINRGVENISQSEEIKMIKRNTCLEHFGVNVPLQSDKVKSKYVNTFLENYGVSNPSQYLDFFNKAQQNMRGSHQTGYIAVGGKSIFYRSSYEKVFLLGLANFIQNADDVAFETNVQINYFWKDLSRKYFADYLIKYGNVSILFEVKPRSLLTEPQNIAKFSAAQGFILENNIQKFVILTEEDLFGNFCLEKYFEV